MEFYFSDEIYKQMKENREFTNDLAKSLKRFLIYDFGDICEKAKEKNRISLSNKGSLIAAYNLNCGKICIRTTSDRSAISIFFKK